MFSIIFDRSFSKLTFSFQKIYGNLRKEMEHFPVSRRSISFAIHYFASHPHAKKEEMLWDFFENTNLIFNCIFNQVFIWNLGSASL